VRVSQGIAPNAGRVPEQSRMCLLGYLWILPIIQFHGGTLKSFKGTVGKMNYNSETVMKDWCSPVSAFSSIFNTRQKKWTYKLSTQQRRNA
jgi:hypothetical protein